MSLPSCLPRTMRAWPSLASMSASESPGWTTARLDETGAGAVAGASAPLAGGAKWSAAQPSSPAQKRFRQAVESEERGANMADRMQRRAGAVNNARLARQDMQFWP